ncbi:MAG: Obg family GTPase CgtA, partial [Dehalococcoidales bacterium]|nr:Obg family GTPase CgtA [Dehalococcoidales bacterium]
PQPRGTGAGVHREGDTFIVEAPGMGRLVAEGGTVSPEVRYQLKRRLTRLGIGRTLQKAGIKPGDKVRCGTLEWEW